MNTMRTALATLCRGGLRWGAVGCTVLALAFSAPLARAGASPVPVIDGNLDDMITYAGSLGSTGCGLTPDDPAQDVRIFDTSIIPCVPVVDNYYVNGFDMTKAVIAYTPANGTLYLGIRVAGIIGDPDGNSDPDTGCPGTTVNEQPGIGADDDYKWEIDANCDGLFETAVDVRNNAVTVNGVPYPGATFARNGHDLEVAVPNFTLGPAFNARIFSGNISDGLGEDTRTASCRPPGPQISVQKDANVPALCPGASVTYTIVVTNTSPITPLDVVTLSDVIPAGLQYTAASASNGCGVGAPSLNGSTLTWPTFSLAAGASCTFTYQATRVAAACSGNFVNVATAVGSYSNPCVNAGEPQTVQASDDATVGCNDSPCVSAAAECSPAAACPGSPVQVTGRATNCSSTPETIILTVAGQQEQFNNVAPGATVEKVVTTVMPACTAGQNVRFDVVAVVPGDSVCPGTPRSEASCTIACQEPQIDVEKSGESTVEPGGTIHYTITVTNPSQTVALTNLQVCDEICAYSRYAGNANIPPTSAPAVGQTGTVCWEFPSLAPGQSITITFEATAVGNADPCTEDVTCTNRVTARGFCGDAEARDVDTFDTLIPCTPQGLCRFTGGGCLNEGDAGNKGKKQHTFGGNVSPAHDGGGPTGNSWEHVVRDGRVIKFNFHSWDPYVTSCTVVDPGPCHPTATNTRADFRGPGKYSDGAGSRENDCYFEAYIIDHREGACNRDNRDEYAITVWDSPAKGVVIFSFAQQSIDCGNFQIHETPRWLFGSNITAPSEPLSNLESVAMLNRAVPNPFSSTTSFAYKVPEGGSAVEIGVYNVAGRLVKTLASGSQAAGTYTVTWDGTDASGIRMSAGVYFLKSRVGADTVNSRVIYVAR